MKNVRNWILLVSFAVTSCILESPEENFVNLDKRANPNYISKLYYTNGGSSYYPLKDTLRLYNSVNLQLDGGVLYDFKILINNSTVVDYGSKTSEITLQRNNLPSGNHSLKVIQRVKSGTNSLADKARVEYAEYESEYVLIVGASTYTPEITSIELVNGSVKVTWKPYYQGDFQGFRLFKSVIFESSSYRSFSFAEKSINSFIDYTYVGNTIRYVLEVNQGGRLTYSEPKTFSIPYNTKMELEKISNQRLKLSWSLPPFFNNIRYLKVFKNGQLLQDNVNPNITSIEHTGSLIFGQSNTYSLLLVAKGTETFIGLGDQVNYTEELLLGKRIQPFHDIRYIKDKNEYFLSYKPTEADGVRGYFRLGNNFNVIDSVVYPYTPYNTGNVNFIVSPNGQYMYVLKLNTIEQRDINNLATVVTYTPKQLGADHNVLAPNSIDNEKDYFAVSNNNLLLLKTNSVATYGSYGAHIIDMNLKKRIFYLDVVSKTHLSSDGIYFINDISIYKYNGETFLPTGTLPYSDIKFFQFIDDQPNNLMILTSDRIIIYNCSTNTETISWQYSPHTYSYPHFDQSSKKVSFVVSHTGYQTQKIGLFDITTGMQETVDVSGSQTILEGNILLHPRGFAFIN